MRFIQSHCNSLGCTKKHHSRGFCQDHYYIFVRDNKLRRLNNKLENNIDYEYKDRNSWSISIRKIFKDKCMICGWNEDSCDVHHIQPVRENGKNILQNGIVLCPNHHKLADNGKLTKEYLTDINIKAIETLTAVELPKEIECQSGQQNL